MVADLDGLHTGAHRLHHPGGLVSQDGRKRVRIVPLIT